MIALQEQPLARATRGLRAAVAALRTEPDPDRVLRRLTVEERRLVGADVTSILLRSDGPEGWGVLARDQRSLGQLATDGHTAWPASLLSRILREQRPIWITDLETELPGAGPRRPSLGLRSVGLLPIVSENVIYAIVAVAWRRPRRVPEPERLLAEALADQAGLVIELAALRAELEQGGLRAELSARADGAEALLRVAAEVAGRRDVVGIAQDALTAVLKLHQADAGAFYMIDEIGNNLIHVGLTERSAAALRNFLASLVLDHPQIVTDITAQLPADLAEAMTAEGLRSLASVPAISAARTVGALVLCHHGRRLYRPHELALMEAFAVQVAGGLRLASAYSALEQADRQREEFLAMIAHELRHPVAAIATVAETLADTPGLGAREQHALDGLRGQAQNLARLAEEVLDLARMETGMLRLKRNTVDLGNLVMALAREWDEPERIKVDVLTQPLNVNADAELIGRAIDNLIRNALKYSPGSTPVTVTVAGDKRLARIEIRDQGIGIAPSDLDRLFKKYGRVLNPGAASVDGIGLGLYLSRLLVQAHEGTITASSPGLRQGTTFTITLPRL